MENSPSEGRRDSISETRRSSRAPESGFALLGAHAGASPGLDHGERILAGDRCGFAAARRHAVFIEHATKLGAGARDSALHRADLAAADLRRVLVVEAAGTDQDQRF